MKPLSERFEAIEFNSLPDRPHGVKVKLDIVQCIQGRGGHLAGQVEMAQVGAGTGAAGVASARLVGGPVVLRPRRVLDVDPARSGED